MSEMQAQCWICPHCFDDHATNADCKESDLKEAVDYLKQENDELKRKLEKAMSLIKKAQNIERDRVREECGNPGFDGPMTVETWMDEMIKEIKGSSPVGQ